MSVKEKILLNEPLAHSSVLKASSEKRDVRLAVQEIHEVLRHGDPSCVVFHCCADFPLDILSSELARLFVDTKVIGCTSAGEITPLGCQKHSITAFSLPRRTFTTKSVLIPNLAAFSMQDSEILVNELTSSLKKSAVAPLDRNSFALTLLDGMSIREELVLNALSDALQQIPLVGGSAGDNLHFVDTHVYFEGQFHSNAAVMTLVNTTCPFFVFSYHHLIPENEKLVVTRADPYKRVVYEFNAEPAAEEYCRINGLKLEELKSETFALHPLAVQFSEDLYMRSIQQVNDDLSLTFFCAIDIGIVLTKMTSAGLLAHTKTIFTDIKETIGSPQLVIGYDCIHRQIEMEKFKLIEPISKLYCQNNVIGFNTYGEQSNGMHLNHTFTGVAIGSVGDEK